MSHITNTISYLRSTYSTLRPAERKVADVILKDPEQVVHLSIPELSWPPVLELHGQISLGYLL
jgi:hypothetical protein